MQYRSPTPDGGSLVPGGLGAASCKTLGGAGWGLAVGRLLDGGFCWPFGEACAGEARARRLARGTTWFSRLKKFPVRALSAPRPRDAQGRRRSRSVGDAATLGHAVLGSPLDPKFPRLAWDRTAGISGNAAIVSQLRRAPLASPPAPAFGTGAAVVISRRLAPHNVSYDGVSCLSSAGARFRPCPPLGVRAP